MSKKKDSFKPWLSRPTINKSVTLPLTSPLTQRFSGFNEVLPYEFHPNELDPFLLFDAESSMIGTFETPTLDLDPAVPSSLDVITAVRAGVASYTDASGLIQEATANTVRVDHSLGYPAMLIEPSATNLVEYSEDFSDSYWAKYSIVTFTDNYATAPNGTQEASRFVSVGGAYPQFSKGIVGLTIGQLYTVSFYIKSDGTSQIQQVSHITGVSGANTNFTPTDEWVRKSYSFTATATSHQLVVFTNGGSAPASSYLIWGAQFEAGSVATSYIPTSGSAVTRIKDNLTITGSAFSDFFSTTEGTFYTEFVRATGSDGVQRYVLGSQSNSARFCYVQSSSNTVGSYDGENFVGAGNYVAAQLSRYAISYLNSSAIDATSASLNGASEVTNYHNGNLLSVPTQLNIGRSAGNIEHLKGHIKRVIYWPNHSDSL